MNMRKHLVSIFAVALTAAAGATSAQQMSTAPTAEAKPVVTANSNWFARIDGAEVSATDFDLVARETFRNKFYHGSPPEHEINKMLREVGELIIDRTLLRREIASRNISANAAKVSADIENYERRYASNPAWAQQREQALPLLRAQLEEKSRHDTLEKSIRDVSASPAEVLAFYKSNLDLFTEPEKNRVSLILLWVDPSSSGTVWDAAKKEADEILAAITAGADFSEMAKKRSKDVSAPNGGDLGYLHQGMLSSAIELELATMSKGALGGPTRTLEGYVVFRLEDRTPSQLRDFASVEARAKELYLRKKADETWLAYLDSLRASVKIEIGPAFEKIMAAPVDAPAEVTPPAAKQN